MDTSDWVTMLLSIAAITTSIWGAMIAKRANALATRAQKQSERGAEVVDRATEIVHEALRQRVNFVRLFLEGSIRTLRDTYPVAKDSTERLQLARRKALGHGMEVARKPGDDDAVLRAVQRDVRVREARLGDEGFYILLHWSEEDEKRGPR
ncbi:hypothetical protein [Sandaracinus amylolyticus]|nr:hypothetical protein [Sandaracinus amylolyticus]